MTYGWTILVVLVAIGVLAFFGVIDTENWRCKINPNDNCVCEELKYQCDELRLAGHTIPFACTDPIKSMECAKFRKKSQAELSIEDCNDTPDDDKCYCEENKTERQVSDKRVTCYKHEEKIFNNQSEFIDFMNIQHNKSSKSIYEYYDAFIPTRGRYFFDNKGKLLIIDISDYIALELANELNIKIIRIEAIDDREVRCFENITTCIKARPKTDLEKHPENYI